MAIRTSRLRKFRIDIPKRMWINELPKTAANIPPRKVHRPPICEKPLRNVFFLVSLMIFHSLRPV